MTEGESAPRVDYYRPERYWNELGPVIAHQARLSTGTESDWWTRYIKRHYCTPPRRRALVLACGSGWVERALIDEGIVDEIDAFDAEPHYVEMAEKERDGRNINYFVSDFQSFRPRHTYDLVVNYAAMHHAAYLYRHCHRLSKAMSADGIFVNWDYLGADRNQYDEQHLARLSAYNLSMPERLRTHRPLRPSLRIATKYDPTEAVHSSEIVRALENEFDVVTRRDLGGALAYPLLWNNIDEFEKGDDESAQVLGALLAEDERVTREGELPTLFTFIIARPRIGGRRPRALYDLCVREPIREWLAGKFGEMYFHEVTATVRRYHLWNPRAMRRYRRELSRSKV